MKQAPRLPSFAILSLAIAALAANALASGPAMPTFFARHDYPESSNFVQVADTNGDGIPDLIASAFGSIKVQFGNGYGTFVSGPSSTTAASGAANAAIAADLNGDGKIDLALTTDDSAVISLGNGNGTFQTGTSYPISDATAYLVIGDFNGDGIPDVAVTGRTGVWLLTGKGGGIFNPAVLAVPLTNCFSIAAADFNEDGKLDLAVTRPSDTGGDGFAVILGSGNGAFQTPQTFSTPQSPSAVAAGSLTKGGPPGFAISGPNGDAYLYFGNGKGSFAGPRLVSLPGAGTNGLVIGDVNGDGLPDLVSDGGSVAYGEGGGYFTKAVNYPVASGNGGSNVVLADLRNNGETDIITGGYGTYSIVSVLLNLGKGYMEDGIWTSVTGGASCAAGADFNGDGKPDLAVTTSSGISILLGTEKYLTPFTAGTPIALTGAGCPVVGDLNGDGKPDLLVGFDNSPNSINAYLGNGDGTFTLKSTTPTPNEGGSIVVADFNHDGKLDFATSGNLIALGNGDGTFQNAADLVANPPTGGFSGIAVGDINNDGWPDLVLTSDVFPIDANVTVLLNNQQGGFIQVPTSFGPLSVQPILADLNGDGNLDLVISQAGLLFEGPTDYGASVYLGNGAGGFTYNGTVGGQTLYSVSSFVADVNGDGIPDILELFSDTLEIYLGEGGATYATPFAIGTGPSPSGILTENLHGQSPTSGLPDIVAADSSGGVMVLFNLTQ